MPRHFLRIAIVGAAAFLATVVMPLASRAQTDAAKSFKTNCALCHAQDGSGNSSAGKALGAKDLRSQEVQAKSDSDLALTISKGKGKMPAFSGKLKGDEIKQMIGYIRDLAKAK
jgi:mono/diheme cytochrome c family protein